MDDTITSKKKKKSKASNMSVFLKTCKIGTNFKMASNSRCYRW